MDEGLTGGFDIPVEELAELVVYKIGYFYPMIVDIVLHDSQYHHTESALILESSVVGPSNGGEVRIGAGLLHLCYEVDHLGEVFFPLGGVGDGYDSLQMAVAVDCLVEVQLR